MNSRNLTPENFIAAHYVKASRGSRIKYEKYLEEQRKAKSSNGIALKCKAVQESIDVVSRKKAPLETTVSELFKDSDRFSLEAENAKKTWKR